MKLDDIVHKRRPRRRLGSALSVGRLASERKAILDEMRPGTIGTGDSHFDLDLRVSSGFANELLDLSRELNETPGRILAKAVALYRMAADARERGERVAILDADLDEVKSEITGL